MRIRASWPLYEPNNLRDGVIEHLKTPNDVAPLVERLADPNAGAARIVHENRPLTIDEEGMSGPRGKEIIDHDVLIAVKDGFGYMSYFSPEFDYACSQLVGDPKSPQLIAEPMEFDAGTGVPVDTLTAALTEFLVTAQRPTCVRWIES